MRREWKLAREKVDEEMFCRVCRRNYGIEAAHILGREHDRKDGINYKAWPTPAVCRVNPDRIVPLCGPATDPTSCHGRYDNHRLDLTPYLHVIEVVQAVYDSASFRSNGLTLALKRISGDELKVAA